MRVLERTGFALVLQAAAVEAALLPAALAARVVREGTAAAGLAVFPSLRGDIEANSRHDANKASCYTRDARVDLRTWLHAFLTRRAVLPFTAVL